MKLKDASVLFGKINEKFLLPVLWVQGTENDTAHGVVSPEEEPVGEGGRERGELRSEGSRKMEVGWGVPHAPEGWRWSRNCVMPSRVIWGEEQKRMRTWTTNSPTLGRTVLARGQQKHRQEWWYQPQRRSGGAKELWGAGRASDTAQQAAQNLWTSWLSQGWAHVNSTVHGTCPWHSLSH